MYYRMIRLHFEENRFDSLIEWAESVRGRIEALEGLRFLDLVRGGPTDGMVIAAYDDEGSSERSSAAMAVILEEMGEYLTGAPHGHDGTVALSFGA